ncbi:MAG: hypothetical protein O2968_17560 [Acidobacteria bacterium]|nr:hypothetical protein [Acidobacteriota bacterium]
MLANHSGYVASPEVLAHDLRIEHGSPSIPMELGSATGDLRDTEIRSNLLEGDWHVDSEALPEPVELSKERWECRLRNLEDEVVYQDTFVPIETARTFFTKTT